MTDPPEPISYFQHSMSPSASEGNPYTMACIQNNITADKGTHFAIVRFQTINAVGMDCPENDGCASSYNIALSSGSSTHFSMSGSTGANSGAGQDCSDVEIAPGSYWSVCKHVELVNISAATAEGPATLTFTAFQFTSAFHNPIGYTFEVDTTFRLTLTNTSKSFLPLDRSDPASGCQTDPNKLGCVSKYVAYFSALWIAGEDVFEQFKKVIVFELDDYTGVITDRPGSSSNFTTPSTNGTPRDYQFDLSVNPGFAGDPANKREIKTAVPVLSAEVTVSSYDYGGIGVLRAKYRVGNHDYYASLVENDIDGVYAPSAPNCAPDFQTRPYAQLPIDVDCNWIADDWEAPYATAAQLGAHFSDRYWDSEKTSNAASGVIPGDGYGAYDEYRGFHTISETGTPVHRRTDPLKLTSFYHDKSSGPLKQALTAFLVPTLSSEIEFHELNETQFRPTIGDKSLELNQHSEAPAALRNYPVVLWSNSNHSECQTTGAYGSARGIGKIDNDIIFCSTTIQGAAAGDAVLESTAWAVLVAHEVGHRFNLRHPAIELPYHTEAIDPANAISIVNGFGPGGSKYAESSTTGNVFFAKLRYRRTGQSPLFVTLPVDAFDYFDYTNVSHPEWNTALSGLLEQDVAILEYTNPPTPNTATFQDSVAQITLASPLSSAGTRYKSPARLQLYQRQDVMSYAFLFDIADPILANYSISNHVPRIQLQK